jgi:hypothetical protein
LEIKYDLKQTKHLYQLFIDQKVVVYLNNKPDEKLTGILLHQTSFDILIKVKVKVKTANEVIEKEKLRLIPKHSILYLKEA